MDLTTLPAGLPRPEDDGGARHLPGLAVPSLPLPATTGEPLPPDWDLIPGARGCTAETCGFRDHYAELAAAEARVFGLSTQPTGYQRELARRLHLPFPILSDAGLALTRALRLPTFEVEGRTLLKRLTLMLRAGRIEHVFYPVFPPDRHAEEVLAWLR